MQGQLNLFKNENERVEELLEEYVDYSDLGKTQAMEKELHILTDFINEYSETMIPLLDTYLRRLSEKS